MKQKTASVLMHSSVLEWFCNWTVYCVQISALPGSHSGSQMDVTYLNFSKRQQTLYTMHCSTRKWWHKDLVLPHYVGCLVTWQTGTFLVKSLHHPCPQHSSHFLEYHRELLSPYVFSLFINDLPQVIQKVSLICLLMMSRFLLLSKK